MKEPGAIGGGEDEYMTGKGEEITIDRHTALAKLQSNQQARRWLSAFGRVCNIRAELEVRQRGARRRNRSQEIQSNGCYGWMLGGQPGPQTEGAICHTTEIVHAHEYASQDYIGM
eukprot:TRINITY_DN15515_c0_g1_i1.p1 TRINITY_DN15515_c0_g1~~TRINITY_DN15515_c0_g1_i1.p1  ORF type:complete len:115 (+),score=10.56 TRINITY_DN15515_c0_g1_i1:149-493(+)